MKKFFPFFFLALFLLASGVHAQEVTTSQALKSFSAWSIVHYRDYGGNWDEMWNGWLDDPVVPEDIKAKGIQDKEEIRQSMQNLKESIASFRDQAAESGAEALKQTRSWLEDLKNSTKKEIDETLDKAIRGQ